MYRPKQFTNSQQIGCWADLSKLVLKIARKTIAQITITRKYNSSNYNCLKLQLLGIELFENTIASTKIYRIVKKRTYKGNI